MKSKLVFGLTGSVMLVLLTGCDAVSDATNDNEELVVYSSRNEMFVSDLLNKFEEDTGIEVNALHGVEPLQILEERNNTQADVFISNDIGALEYLKQEDLLKATDPDNIESIEELYRAENNEWVALSSRARGFIYNKDLIDESDVPTKMEDLIDNDFSDIEKGYAITRGGNGGMISNVSALRYEWGDERTQEWIEAIQDNSVAIYEGHGDIRRAVGEGIHAFGLVNNYYYHQQLLEPDNNNVGFVYPDQEEGDMGAIVNGAGVGLLKDSPNDDSAQLFLNWLLEEENQLAFVGESLEVPINSDLTPPFEEALKLTELNVQKMPLRELGNYFEDTRLLIEAAGLDLNLK